MEIAGKGSIVVGGASGMGRATAERLKTRGASVAILDLERSAGSEVAAELGGSFHPCDVTDAGLVDVKVGVHIVGAKVRGLGVAPR